MFELQQSWTVFILSGAQFLLWGNKLSFILISQTLSVTTDAITLLSDLSLSWMEVHDGKQNNLNHLNTFYVRLLILQGSNKM